MLQTSTTTTAFTTSLDLALALAAVGLPVFPCTALKRPACAHGFKDATTNPRLIRELWALAGAAAQLCGVPTGEASGFDVLDVDPRHGGHLWEAANLTRLPETRIHQTGGGGRHHVFRHIAGVRNTEARIAPGVDTRGEGGYAIWPPSRGYSVIHEADVAPWPDWLLPLVLKAAEPEAATMRPAPTAADLSRITSKRLEGKLRSLLRNIETASKGSVHDTLLRISRVVGGYAWLLPYSKAELLGLLLKALPADDNPDPVNERKTALAGLERGMTERLTLEDRPWSEWRRSA